MSPNEARRLLGLGADASPGDVLGARRRLAKSLHPDAGGDPAAMRAVNEAAQSLLAELARSQPATDARDVRVAARPAAPTVPADVTHGSRFDHDVASFTIEALPVEAFEALVVATSWLGEVLVDEPPYQLDVVLGDPIACWCRLDLVPDAGASTVALTIAALPDHPLPPIDDVRDVWVAALNELGRDPSQLDRERR
jgi:hypothetical protein